VPRPAPAIDEPADEDEPIVELPEEPPEDPMVDPDDPEVPMVDPDEPEVDDEPAPAPGFIAGEPDVVEPDPVAVGRSVEPDDVDV